MNRRLLYSEVCTYICIARSRMKSQNLEVESERQGKNIKISSNFRSSLLAISNLYIHTYTHIFK